MASALHTVQRQSSEHSKQAGQQKWDHKKHNIIDIIRYSTAERVLQHHNLNKVITRTECVQYNLYSSLCCEFNKMVQCWSPTALAGKVLQSVVSVRPLYILNQLTSDLTFGICMGYNLAGRLKVKVVG